MSVPSDDRPACSQGLTESAVLPGRLGRVTGAMADLLQAHMWTLGLDDGNSRREQAAHEELIAEPFTSMRCNSATSRPG